jgi:hypothetical protein
MEQMIEALQTERRGYVARGLQDRVAEVDAQLSALGVEVPRVEDVSDRKSRVGRKAG